MTAGSIATTTGVDWVTCTTGVPRDGWRWLEMFNGWRKEHPSEMAKTVRMHGFSGLKCNGAVWAQREADQRFMVIASGETARVLWRKLVPTAAKVTRIDICTDVWLCAPKEKLIENSARVPLSGMLDGKLKYSLWYGMSKLPGVDTKANAQTLYVGSRSSEQMGRLYDKGVQTSLAGPGYWFRYEVELKGTRAIQAARRLADEEVDNAGASDNLSNMMRASVYDWFIARSVVPVFLRDTQADGLHTRTFVRQSTPEKKIAWLRSQVRPTVAYLFQAGFGREAVDALGICQEELTRL
jgi:DNA relaxase NicK